MSLPTFGFSTTSDEVAEALSSEIAGKNGEWNALYSCLPC
jgi:hypothetical protein